MRRHRTLRVADLAAVDVDRERCLRRAKAEEHLLLLKRRRQRKRPSVDADLL
ncbi:hypothetical protein SDC9_197594 [bioreactor metagenome]|uniref:Uncharacterized protein n=1 Tax=bioreactor metagenome TaxID=1076179 RepID=A0A645IFT1_9ZZZZ